MALAITGCGNILESRATKGSEAIILWTLEYSGDGAVTKPGTRDYGAGETRHLIPGEYFGHQLNILPIRDGVGFPFEYGDAQLFVFGCAVADPKQSGITLLAALFVEPGHYALAGTVQRGVVEKGLTGAIRKNIYFVTSENVPANQWDEIRIGADTPTFTAAERQATYIGSFTNEIDVELIPAVIFGTYPILRSVTNSYQYDQDLARDCLEKAELRKLPLTGTNIFADHQKALDIYSTVWASKSEEVLAIP